MDRNIERLAQELIRQGHLDNEADARLAAINIILAAEQGLDGSEGGLDDVG